MQMLFISLVVCGFLFVCLVVFFRTLKPLTNYKRARYSLAHLVCSQGKKQIAAHAFSCSWVCIKLCLTPSAILSRMQTCAGFSQVQQQSLGVLGMSAVAGWEITHFAVITTIRRKLLKSWERVSVEELCWYSVLFSVWLIEAGQSMFFADIACTFITGISRGSTINSVLELLFVNLSWLTSSPC